MPFPNGLPQLGEAKAVVGLVRHLITHQTGTHKAPVFGPTPNNALVVYKITKFYLGFDHEPEFGLVVHANTYPVLICFRDATMNLAMYGTHGSYCDFALWFART